MNSIFSINLDSLKKSRGRGRKSILKDFYGKNVLYYWYINDKYYIGITTNLQVRLKNYLAHSSKDHYISRAINKYPDKDILFGIINIFDSIEELMENEKLYIQRYNTISDGYNLTSGGEHFKLSARAKAKMINSSKNKKSVYFKNITTGDIIKFISVRESARYFKCNSTTIFAALRNKTLFRKSYLVSYSLDYLNNHTLPTPHNNTNVMKGNRNGTKYIWTIVFDNNERFEADSLLKLYSKVQNIKFSTFRRIAEGKMVTNNFNFKIYKNKKHV